MSHQRVSGFPETVTGAGLWGGLGNLWIALQIHSERSSGEVTKKLLEKLGETLGGPGALQKPGKPKCPENFVQNFVHNIWSPQFAAFQAK